ncbi:MAG: hypothetical protein AABZ47_17475 [Planctomycetota bacterium]
MRKYVLESSIFLLGQSLRTFTVVPFSLSQRAQNEGLDLFDRRMFGLFDGATKRAAVDPRLESGGCARNLALALLRHVCT